jgi:hypothetical protein
MLENMKARRHDVPEVVTQRKAIRVQQTNSRPTYQEVVLEGSYPSYTPGGCTMRACGFSLVPVYCEYARILGDACRDLVGGIYATMTSRASR